MNSFATTVAAHLPPTQSGDHYNTQHSISPSHIHLSPPISPLSLPTHISQNKWKKNMVREYPFVGVASSSEDFFFLFSLNALIFPQFFPILPLVNFSYSVEFGNSFGKVWCFVLYFISTLPFLTLHTEKKHIHSFHFD